ncbi:APC family permease [Streptomyces sp. SID8352]|uniref:APC family permease n=1 Tax=Streptomyces sp. SID8352 TaxID=2690338 RepID=UPI00136C596D|nr:APC family permease [Streptomyces sp. SID8352]MYU22611.1 amino acid permease [Streptomyces sp. SID8352]
MDSLPSTRSVPADPPAPTASPPQEPRRLSGNIGVIGLVFTVLAFNAPLAVMAGFVPLVVGYGNRVGAPSTYLVIGALLLLFSVGLTTMSRFMSSPGAFYCYIAAGIGKVPGLAGAFVAFGAYVAIAAGSYAYGGILVDTLVHDLLGGPSLDWWVWSLVLWTGASVLTMLHIDLSTRVLGVTMCAEVVIVLIWQIAVAVNGGPEGRSLSSFTPDAFTSGSLSFALLFGVLCVTGFEAVAVFREEARDPARTIPRATYTAVAFLAVLYGLGAWAYIVAFGPSRAPDSALDPSGSFLASMHEYVGRFAVDVVIVLLVTSAFAAILATQNIAARYLYSLGHDAVLTPRLARVHRRHGSPYVAAATVALLCLGVDAVAALAGTDPVTLYAALTGFGGFGILLLMTATSVAVILFFRSATGHTASAWRSRIAPSLSLAGLLTVLVLATTNMDSIIGSELGGNLVLALAAAIMLGGAALALVYRSRRPEVYSRIGRQDV